MVESYSNMKHLKKKGLPDLYNHYENFKYYAEPKIF